MINRLSLQSITYLQSTHGSEAIVYFNETYAYRVSGLDAFEKYNNLKNHSIEGLVDIYDVWEDNNKLIVKMPRLFILSHNFNSDELDELYGSVRDLVKNAESYCLNIKDSVLKTVVELQTQVAKSIGSLSWDYGPHNVMQDKNSRFFVIDP